MFQEMNVMNNIMIRIVEDFDVAKHLLEVEKKCAQDNINVIK